MADDTNYITNEAQTNEHDLAMAKERYARQLNDDGDRMQTPLERVTTNLIIGGTVTVICYLIIRLVDAAVRNH